MGALKSYPVSKAAPLILGALAFVSIVGEMGPVAMVNEISVGMDVSLEAVGLLLSVFSFTVVLATAPLTYLFRRTRRWVLLSLVIGSLSIGHILSALSPGYAVLLVIRIFTGAGHGLFWVLAASTLSRLYPPERFARAMSVVIGGGALATILGIPAANLFGHLFGWRWVFLSVGLLLLAFLPVVIRLFSRWPVLQKPIPKSRGKTPSGLGVVWLVCLITLVVLLGHFLLASYIPAYLGQIYGVRDDWVSGVLFLYGIGGALGTLLAGTLLASRPLFGLALGLLTAVVAVGVFWLAGPVWLLGYILWGVAFGSVPVFLSTLTQIFSSEHNRDPANAFLTVGFNVGIGGGAWLGGFVLSRSGFLSLPPFFLLTLVGGLALLGAGWVFGLFGKNRSRPRAVDNGD